MDYKGDPDTRLDSMDESYITDEGRKDTSCRGRYEGADECTYVDYLRIKIGVHVSEYEEG